MPCLLAGLLFSLLDQDVDFKWGLFTYLFSSSNCPSLAFHFFRFYLCNLTLRWALWCWNPPNPSSSIFPSLKNMAWYCVSYLNSFSYCYFLSITVFFLFLLKIEIRSMQSDLNPQLLKMQIKFNTYLIRILSGNLTSILSLMNSQRHKTWT